MQDHTSKSGRMDPGDRGKTLSDPLFDGFDRNHRRKKKPSPKTIPGAHSGRKQSSGSGLKVLAVAAMVLVLMGLGYYLYEAQNRIDQLSTQLAVNEGQLSEVSQDLGDSKNRIEVLDSGLAESRNKLQLQDRELGRYKSLYTGLREEQEQQVRELEALNVEKANQSEVVALQDETSQLRSGLEETETKITGLDDRARQNASDLQETRTQLQTLEGSVAGNQREIASVKKSLEREYYNFELQEKGSYMKVFEIALRLTDIDHRKQQFDMDLLADSKILRKRDHSLNEPILFYLKDQKKPYEVVVTRIEERYVVGYLSIPKG